MNNIDNRSLYTHRQSAIPQGLNPQLNNKNKFQIVLKKRNIFIGLLVIINILIFLGIGFLVYKSINPINSSSSNSSEVIDKVAKLTKINTIETPTIATISSIDKLIQSNAIQAQVYKDAKNGDIILNYSDKMIIYRDSENKIIYEGDSPTKILSDTQKKITDKIVELAKAAKILTVDDSETPQLSAVSDAILAKKSTSDFYKDVKKDDVIGIFPSNQIIVIYRPSTQELIKSGTYETVIHPS